ncbi:condensin complex subunit 2/barren [Dipodascopsis uninucleata]
MPRQSARLPNDDDDDDDIYKPLRKGRESHRSRKVSLSPIKSRVKPGAAMNDDRSEKLKRISMRRNALNEINMNVIETPRTSKIDATSKQSLDDEQYNDMDDISNATETLRTLNLSNFEEWMKLATDNKINATNSWNFALIDYFHDMSLLKEGDGINFQKASCTLDGCIKIYTSRIDSIATETGRLLSGLTEHNREARSAESSKGDQGNDGEDDEDDDKQKQKSRRRLRSEATLAKDFSSIQQKRLDLDFNVDPLFKKASADFDEGGAKGMLLNHLSIDNTGRIVFDTSEQASIPSDIEIETQDIHADEFDFESLKSRYLVDIAGHIDSMFISPSLKDFEFSSDSNTVPLDIPFLNTFGSEQDLYDNASGEDPLGFEGDDGLSPVEAENDDMNEKREEFGNGGELWLSNLRAGSQEPEFQGDIFNDDFDGDDNDFDTGDSGQATYVFQFAKNNLESNENDILAYFNEHIQKKYTALEHWKLQKVKKDTNTKKQGQPRQSKKKEQLMIDFYDEVEVDESVLFEQNNTAVTLLPKSQWRSQMRNLLPEDINFNPKQLMSLFLKPRVKLRFVNPEERQRRQGNHALVPSAPINSDGQLPLFDDTRHEDADTTETPHMYDATFFNDDGFDVGPTDGNSFSDTVALEPEPENNGRILTTIDPSRGVTSDHNSAATSTNEETKEEFDFGSQLVLNGGRKYRADYVSYAKIAKKVDVKKLKDNIWNTFDMDTNSCQGKKSQSQRSITPAEDKSDVKRFSEIVTDLQYKYPKQAMADISTSFCFICVLHLANEKGLEIQNNSSFTDLTIKRDPNALIEDV